MTYDEKGAEVELGTGWANWVRWVIESRPVLATWDDYSHPYSMVFRDENGTLKLFHKKDGQLSGVYGSGHLTYQRDVVLEIDLKGKDARDVIQEIEGSICINIVDSE